MYNPSQQIQLIELLNRMSNDSNIIRQNVEECSASDEEDIPATPEQQKLHLNQSQQLINPFAGINSQTEKVQILKSHMQGTEDTNQQCQDVCVWDSIKLIFFYLDIKSKLMQKGVTKQIDPINTIIELYTNIVQTLIDYMNREEDKSSKVSFVEEKKNRLCPICETSIEENRLNMVRKYIDETWVTGLTLQAGALQSQQEEINPDDIFSNMEDQQYIKTVDKILSNKKAYKYKTSHTSTVLQQTFKINLQKKTQIVNMSFNDKDIKSAKDAMDYALGMLNSQFKSDLIEKLVPILLKLITRFHYSQKQKHKQSFGQKQIQTDQFTPLKKLKIMQEKAQILHRNLYYKQNQVQQLKKTIKKLQTHGQVQSEQSQEQIKKLKIQNLQYKQIKKTLELDIKKLQQQVAKLQKHLNSMQIIQQRRSSKRNSIKISQIIRLQQLQDQKDQKLKSQKEYENQNGNENQNQNQNNQQCPLEQHNHEHQQVQPHYQPQQKINIAFGQGQGAQRKKSKLFRSKDFMHRISKSKQKQSIQYQQQNTDNDGLDMKTNVKGSQKQKNTISPKIIKTSKNTTVDNSNYPSILSRTQNSSSVVEQSSTKVLIDNSPEIQKQSEKSNDPANTNHQQNNQSQNQGQNSTKLIQNSNHTRVNHLNKKKQNRKSTQYKTSNANHNPSLKRQSARNSKQNKKNYDIKTQQNKQNKQVSLIYQTIKTQSKKPVKKQQKQKYPPLQEQQNTLPSLSHHSSSSKTPQSNLQQPINIQSQKYKTQQQIYDSLRQDSKQSNDTYDKQAQTCDYLWRISDNNKYDQTENNSFEYNQSFIKPVNSTIQHLGNTKNIFKSAENKTIKHSRYPSETNKTIHNSSVERISNVQTLYSSPLGTKRQSIIGKPFNSKDLKDIFGSIQQAYHFQSNRQYKPKSHKSPQSTQKPSTLPLQPPPQKQLLTSIYSHITHLKKKLPQLYDWVKNFLKFPYQTAINNNNSSDLTSNLSENTFDLLFSRILSLHTNCKNSKNKTYCEHIKAFLFKINYKQEENDKVVVLPSIQKRNEA